MNSASKDVKDMLVDDSAIGLTEGVDLFRAQYPTDPANIVSIYDTVGGMTEMYLTGENDYNPSIQILVRNVDYDAGYALIRQITDSLHGRANVTWNGTVYLLIKCVQDPYFLDYDEKGRVRFVVNFNIKRR